MLGEPALGNLIFPVWPLVLILWSKCSPSRTPSPAKLGSGCCQCSDGSYKWTLLPPQYSWLELPLTLVTWSPWDTLELRHLCQLETQVHR